MRAIGLALLSAGLWAGTVDAAGSRLAEGAWGGRGARMEVSKDGARIELDCAHGRMVQAPSLDQDGAFDEAGDFVREHGGPVRIDEKPEASPVRYKGTLKDGVLTLKIVGHDDADLGSFTLEHGKAGRLLKCK